MYMPSLDTVRSLPLIGGFISRLGRSAYARAHTGFLEESQRSLTEVEWQRVLQYQAAEAALDDRIRLSLHQDREVRYSPDFRTFIKLYTLSNNQHIHVLSFPASYRIRR